MQDYQRNGKMLSKYQHLFPYLPNTTYPTIIIHNSQDEHEYKIYTDTLSTVNAQVQTTKTGQGKYIPALKEITANLINIYLERRG